MWTLNIMIDTGSNIYLINHDKLNRIQKKKRVLPTFSITNIHFIRATGCQNNSVKKQMLVNLHKRIK